MSDVIIKNHSYPQFPRALDLLRLLRGPLEQAREGVREVQGRLQLVVRQHPQEVVQDDHQATAKDGAVLRGNNIDWKQVSKLLQIFPG